ncbi:hypothetical protein BST92_14300 [Nonlabens arenilitoris]|uniref:Uncharacterized protein n=1 Tax=Nonlabens arenilitoris TaxID=1217969 RepID=A0A2S7UEK0_9FLAO|nr:hypothetical protein [Nonlabens arenilitoris]PQJ33021.1 hypothetical protein BST92_14300 [Nonlabens arenilitoris]
MKKYLLTIMLLLFVLNSFAQKKTKEERQAELDAKKEGNYIAREKLDYSPSFALLLAQGQMFTKKVNVTIDFGQKSGFFEQSYIRDENGKKIKFYTVIDALNYMKSLGWEFIDAYAITIGNSNVYHYLFKNDGNAKIPNVNVDGEENDDN